MPRDTEPRSCACGNLEPALLLHGLPWVKTRPEGSLRPQHGPTLHSLHTKVSVACRGPIPATTALSAAGKLEGGDPAFATPLVKARWGSQQGLIEAQEAEVVDVEFEEDKAAASVPLTFEEDAFISTAETEHPPAAAVSTTGQESGATPIPALWFCSTCVNLCQLNWRFPGPLP